MSFTQTAVNRVEFVQFGVKPRKHSHSSYGNFVQSKVLDIAKATKTFEC